MKDKTIYKTLMMSSEKEFIDIVTLEREMKKLKGWTLDSVKRMHKTGWIGYILVLSFVK